MDARDGIVATHGWRQSSGISVLDLSEELAADGVASVLYTDVARDGMDAGAALEATAAVAKVIPTIASGGVRGAEDVAALSKIAGRGRRGGRHRALRGPSHANAINGGASLEILL